MEMEDLRGGKNTIKLNVIVRPNRSDIFPWTTDTETTTISKLEKAIHAVHPDREDGDVVLVIIHSHGTAQHKGGGTEYPSDDAHFRDIIQQYRRTNTWTLTVALETPIKKYTDFTLTKVNSLYEISNIKVLTMSDLPPFHGISTEALDIEFAQGRLLDEIDFRIRATPSYAISTEGMHGLRL
ncbi:hypothetical protein BGZ58_007805 [Dissophora ornata]|nr:hypothetical protein BGZ58_007805 [Dissophora ornata]